MVCVFSVQNRICKCKGEDISKHCVQSFCCLAPSVESLWQEKRANFLVERGPTPIFASFCTLIQCIYGATTKVQTFLPKKEKKYDCISSKVVSIHFQKGAGCRVFFWAYLTLLNVECLSESLVQFFDISKIWDLFSHTSIVRQLSFEFQFSHIAALKNEAKNAGKFTPYVVVVLLLVVNFERKSCQVWLTAQ